MSYYIDKYFMYTLFTFDLKPSFDIKQIRKKEILM